MIFNENSRVKIPAVLHLMRLGYTYISMNEQQNRRGDTNIFEDIFVESLLRINPDTFGKKSFDSLGKAKIAIFNGIEYLKE